MSVMKRLEGSQESRLIVVGVNSQSGDDATWSPWAGPAVQSKTGQYGMIQPTSWEGRQLPFRPLEQTCNNALGLLVSWFHEASVFLAAGIMAAVVVVVAVVVLEVHKADMALSRRGKAQPQNNWEMSIRQRLGVRTSYAVTPNLAPCSVFCRHPHSIALQPQLLHHASPFIHFPWFVVVGATPTLGIVISATPSLIFLQHVFAHECGTPRPHCDP